MRRHARALFLLFAAMPAFAAHVEIREGRFFVDDKPFYVKAVAYGPWRPHQAPGTSYTDTDRAWMDHDFARIEAAHFNTIRTWEALDAEALALASAHHLMVLQGVRIDPRQDFSDPHNLETVAEQVRRVAEKSRDADNVLGYLLMSRADPATILHAGLEPTHEFFRRLKRTIQAIDPRPVAFERWWPDAFFEDADGDFGAFSAFPFWPKALSDALGYAGLVRWLADRLPPDKPLLITETGGYSVSTSSRTEAGGAGGFKEYDQSLKDIESLRATVEGHAQGAAVVSWLDSWYFPRDPDTHDDEPWEWTGLLAIPTDSKKDMEGLPRQAYRDMTDYNQLVPVEPRANHFYRARTVLPIRVYGSPETMGIRYSVNGDDWRHLQGSGQGLFVGSFQLPKLARRRQRITFQALDKDDSTIASKEISFIAALEPESVRLALSESAKEGGAFRFHVVVRDADGQPLARRKVTYGCYYPISGREASGVLTTDGAGLLDFNCPPPPNGRHDRYLYAAAGTESTEHVKTGDLRIFTIAR